MTSINRRTFVKASGLLALGGLAARAGAAPAASPPRKRARTGAAAPAPAPVFPGGRPDILVIFTDQWSPRETPRWGTPARTPNLDAIAAEGMRFYSAYSSSPVSMPARGCLLTGLFPHNTGLWGNTSDYTPPVRQARLFADVKAAGYTTAQIGKTHWFAGTGWRKEQGFPDLDAFYAALGLDHVETITSPFSTPQGKGAYADYLRGIGKFDAVAADLSRRLKDNQYEAGASVCTPAEHNEMFVTRRAVEFIKKQPPGKPLFLVASWFGPHPPFDAPGPYASMYDPASLKAPPNVRLPYRYGGRDYDEKTWREMRANYLGKISYIDDCAGQVVDALKARGNWDNTLVIFISDHGEMLGAQGALSKGRFFEESAGIPMWVRPPKGIKVAAPESDAPVSLNDVYATVVEAAGGKVSPQRVTTSLWPVLLGGDAAGADRTVFAEIYNSKRQGLGYMARKGDYKWFSQDGEHLYDLKNDPFEQNNLIAAPAHMEKARELREDYHEWVLATQLNYSEGYKNMVQRAKEGTL
jgi:arylsulfatase A-like enzyme